MRVVLALALLAAAGTLACAAAHAAESSLLAMFDANHDGRVSLAEYEAYMAKGFHRLDANHDDILEPDEMPRGTHHHGSLTLAAHRKQVARQFHRQDRNHDGYLSLHELMAPPR